MPGPLNPRVLLQCSALTRTQFCVAPTLAAAPGTAAAPGALSPQFAGLPALHAAWHATCLQVPTCVVVPTLPTFHVVCVQDFQH
jgi:hypothetical protein